MQSELQELKSRLNEMWYALVDGNADGDNIPKEVVEGWLNYVIGLPVEDDGSETVLTMRNTGILKILMWALFIAGGIVTVIVTVGDVMQLCR